jgi:hypothetical protein
MAVQFSDLLSKLFDKVNLGQMLVDGGPGVLLALAILLFACHSIPEDSRGSIPFLKLIVKEDLRHTRQEIEEFEIKAATLAGRSAREDQEQQNLAKRIAVAEQGRVHLETATSCTEGSLCNLYKSLASVREAKAKDDKQLEFTAKRLEELRAKLEKRKLEYVRDGRVLLSQLVSLALGLSVFGYILGTLFSGLNYNIWVLGVQRIVLRTLGRAWERVRLCLASSAEEMARIALQGKMRRLELKFGTALVVNEKSKMRALKNLTAAIMYFGGGSRWSFAGMDAINVVRRAMDGPEALKALPVTYYVGRGTISQQDYDGFVTNYFRFVQAAANLIVPVLVLGYALQSIKDENAAGGPSNVLLKYVAPGGLAGLFHSCVNCMGWLKEHPLYSAFILALLLYVTAQLLYNDYKRRLQFFVKGKLDLEKKRRKEAAKQAAEQAAKQSGGSPTPKPADQKSKSDMFKDVVTLITKLIETMSSSEKA